MENQESEVSDIVVIINKECADKIDETVDALKRLEMQIENIDHENGVIEGTLVADKVAPVRKWPCVSYVRVEFTYVAEHPAGNPPDTESTEEDR